MQARSHPEHVAAKRGHHRLFFFYWSEKMGGSSAPSEPPLATCLDSDCIPSLSERRSSISLRLFFSILDDNVPDHLSSFCHWPFIHTATSRTLRNSSAIRLPRPRTSLFRSSSSLPRCFCLQLFYYKHLSCISVYPYSLLLYY